jgi:hypothetical protein
MNDAVHLGPDPKFAVPGAVGEYKHWRSDSLIGISESPGVRRQKFNAPRNRNPVPDLWLYPTQRLGA